VKAAGWTVVVACEDHDHGRSLDRPGINVLRDVVRAGAVDVLLVTHYDRLARSPSDLTLLTAELTSLGCTIVVDGE
jgi:site-specific DNA recombinase